MPSEKLEVFKIISLTPLLEIILSKYTVSPNKLVIWKDILSDLLEVNLILVISFEGFGIAFWSSRVDSSIFIILIPVLPILITYPSKLYGIGKGVKNNWVQTVASREIW